MLYLWNRQRRNTTTARMGTTAHVVVWLDTRTRKQSALVALQCAFSKYKPEQQIKIKKKRMYNE